MLLLMMARCEQLYLKPLRKVANTPTQLLPEDKIKTIFGNVEEIVEIGCVCTQRISTPPLNTTARTQQRTTLWGMHINRTW